MSNSEHAALQAMDLSGLGNGPELVASMRALLDEGGLDRGVLRIKTSGVDTAEGFSALLAQLGRKLMNYEFASTPRINLTDKVYSSTEYPQDQEILLHNEMAYTTFWPSLLWFFCEQPSATGGETPVADSRQVYRSIDKKIRDAFEQKQLVYIRNYRPGMDLSWQSVFATEDKSEVAKRCEKMGLEYQWKGKELKTWQKCQSVIDHPRTGERVWFNQAHVFHISNLPAEYRELLLSMYQEEELPRNVMFADGTPIDESMLYEIKAVLQEHKQAFSWQQGDFMLLDNMMFAHGREPFSGARKIAVAME